MTMIPRMLQMVDLVVQNTLNLLSLMTLEITATGHLYNIMANSILLISKTSPCYHCVNLIQSHTLEASATTRL